MFRKYVKPKRGYSRDQVQNEPDAFNSEMVVEHRDYEWRLPMHRYVQSMFSDELDIDPGMLYTEEFRFQDTSVKMGPFWPGGEVSVNVNPYKQLIARKVMKEGETGFQDIYSFLTREKRVLRDGEQQRQGVKRFVDELHDRGVIVRVTGKGISRAGEVYRDGSRHIRDAYDGWGGTFVKYETGKHIIKNEAIKKIRTGPGLTEDDVVNYLSNDLGWCSAEASDQYLQDLKETGAVRKKGNMLEIGTGLEPIQPRADED